MTRALTSLALCAALAATAAHAATVSTAPDQARRQPFVPKPFRGEWNAKLADCGTGLNDSRLVISAGYIEFYESEGDILAVVTRGQNELGVTAELSGEGDTWLAYSHFTLADDGKTLTHDVAGIEPTKLLRCPTPLKK